MVRLKYSMKDRTLRRRSGQYFTCGNNIIDIGKLIEKLRSIDPALIVLQATGGYEKGCCLGTRRSKPTSSDGHSFEGAIFARSSGTLARTDKIDARMLVRYGRANHPPVMKVRTEHQERMSALMARSSQISFQS